MSGAGWATPPDRVTLGRNEVHVWRVPLRARSALAALGDELSADDRARAARFRAERERDRFLVRRAVLRRLLARYLGVDPTAVALELGRDGKPRLATDAARWLRFNLSSSTDLALYALARDREVGIDVERIDPGRVDDGVVGRFFSATEAAAVRALPADERVRAFFTCWTLKEAFVKARGDGLVLPLDGFDVGLDPDLPSALLATRWDPAEASRWSLRQLSIDPPYAAALAVEGCAARVLTWEFDLA